ncbi:MAG TPA: hypothetical protein VK168_04395 [Saprospiraceae bacterium]|nr:hypothetical protein [Saprospiraceae bacterium]
MKIKFLFAALAVAFAGMSFTMANFGPWELLGSRKIDYKVDRDEILVTRAEGVFSAIQIRVKRSPINMHKLAVHYGNGDVEEIDLRQSFRAGSVSRVIDLPGNKRIIRKVVMWYDTKNLAAGKGVVELWGKH